MNPRRVAVAQVADASMVWVSWGIPALLQSGGSCLAFPWRWYRLLIVRYFKFGKKILFLGRACLLNEAHSYLSLRRNLWLNVNVHDTWLSFLMDGLTGREAIRIS